MGPYGLFLHGHSRMGVARVSLLLTLPSFRFYLTFVSIYMEFGVWNLMGLPMLSAGLFIPDGWNPVLCLWPFILMAFI
jgi:hypothetical protein